MISATPSASAAERAQRLAGGPPAAPGREQEPEPRGEPAVVARLLDEERRRRRRGPATNISRSAAARLPARSQRERDRAPAASPSARRWRRSPRSPGEVESRPLSSAAAAPARRPATRVISRPRTTAMAHDQSAAMRRMSSRSEPGSASRPAVQQQEALGPVDPDVAVEVGAARPPVRDVAVAALVDRQRGRQERDVEDERSERRRGERPPRGAFAGMIRDAHGSTLDGDAETTAPRTCRARGPPSTS